MSDTPADEITSQKIRDIWDRIAGWWDQRIGEGNQFQLQLIMPTTDRLLEIQPGQRVLDIACGNGNYSRRLATQGARVTACDGSKAFIEAAQKRPPPAVGAIEYRVIDATSASELDSLGSDFDAVVCSMALMDMPAIEPLAHTLPQLLKSKGKFVFSVPHPCFNSSYARLTAQLIQENGRYDQAFGVEVYEYLKPSAERSLGIVGQPELHYQFHRPMGMLLAPFLSAGLLLDRLEEPSFPPETPARNAFSWAKRPGLPPAIVVRMRNS